VLQRLPLTHSGEEVGRLALAARGPREEFSAADRRVLDDLARQIGTAVHAVRLSADLQRSREQLVVAREEERRRVGRDLHDGLGPQLASLTMKVETARELIDSNPVGAKELLFELLEQTESAVHDVRRVAHHRHCCIKPPQRSSAEKFAPRVLASGRPSPSPARPAAGMCGFGC
jgi:signal transduction histidine kinase